jgi:hypothetical protein
LKQFEGKLKVENVQNGHAYFKNFLKTDTPLLLEESDIKKFQSGFGTILKLTSALQPSENFWKK